MCQLSTGLSVYQTLSIEFERHVNRGLIYKKLFNWTLLSSILHILYTARLYCRVYYGAVYSGRSVSVRPAVSINHDRCRQSTYFLRVNFRSQKIVNLSDVVHCETTPPSLILYYKIPLLISYRLATAFVVGYAYQHMIRLRTHAFYYYRPAVPKVSRCRTRTVIVDFEDCM